MPPREQPASDAPGTPCCSECGSTTGLLDLADLAPGQPWTLCTACLNGIAEASARSEARRKGYSNAAFKQALRTHRDQGDASNF